MAPTPIGASNVRVGSARLGSPGDRRSRQSPHVESVLGARAGIPAGPQDRQKMGVDEARASRSDHRTQARGHPMPSAADEFYERRIFWRSGLKWSDFITE